MEKENDDQEMTYADVRIVKKQGRRVDKSEEADVEYGQVKFSKKPRTSQTNPTMDDTVYAQVRRARWFVMSDRLIFTHLQRQRYERLRERDDSPHHDVGNVKWKKLLLYIISSWNSSHGPFMEINTAVPASAQTNGPFTACLYILPIPVYYDAE